MIQRLRSNSVIPGIIRIATIKSANAPNTPASSGALPLRRSYAPVNAKSVPAARIPAISTKPAAFAAQRIPSSAATFPASRSIAIKDLGPGAQSQNKARAAIRTGTDKKVLSTPSMLREVPVSSAAIVVPMASAPQGTKERESKARAARRTLAIPCALKTDTAATAPRPKPLALSTNTPSRKMAVKDCFR